MPVHPGQRFIAITLHHADKFPAISLVEAYMVRQKIHRIDALCLQLPAGQPQQIPRYALAAVLGMGVYGADIGL